MGQSQSSGRGHDDDDDIELARRRRRGDDYSDDEEEEERRQDRHDGDSDRKRGGDRGQKPGSLPSEELKKSSDPSDNNRAITVGMLDEDNNPDGEQTVEEQEEELAKVAATKKQLQDDERPAIEKEYPMVYGGPCTGANEFNVLVYSGIKIGLYLLVLVIASITMVKDYDLKECFLSGGYCMKFDPNLKVPICATMFDTICRDKCLDTFPTASAATHGCEVLPKAVPDYADYTCITGFHAQCVELESCLPDHTKKMQGSLMFTIAVLGIHIFFELIYAVVMIRFKGRYPRDFDNLNGFDRALTCCNSFWGPMTQLMWVLGFLSAIFIYRTYGTEHGACAGARTSTGGEYSLFSDAWRVGVGSIVMHLLVLAVGTHFRARVPLRGQLYRPGSDSDLAVPLGLDCREIRARSRPRWCGSIFRKFTSSTGCLSCICNCLSWIIDTFCLLTVHVAGWTLEEGYKHRHFIGP